MSEEKKLRKSIVAYARRLSEAGLNVNSSGNLSARCLFKEGEGFLITPSALDYDRMEPEDIVRMIPDGTGFKACGALRPSSEWLMHAKIYEARADVRAVVHTHSLFATAFSCLDEAIPPFHYMVAVAGASDIACAPYATFGSEELADACVSTLGNERKGCLLSHHGVIALGSSLGQAFGMALEIENLARMWMELKKVGGCRFISPEEMKRVKSKFSDYKSSRKQDEKRD